MKKGGRPSLGRRPVVVRSSLNRRYVVRWLLVSLWYEKVVFRVILKAGLVMATPVAVFEAD